jgi:ankyrin repeat protein
MFFKNYCTALIIASKNGNFKVLNFLIENNADMNIQDEVFFLIFYFKKL